MMYMGPREREALTYIYERTQRSIYVCICTLAALIDFEGIARSREEMYKKLDLWDPNTI